MNDGCVNGWMERQMLNERQRMDVGRLDKSKNTWKTDY